MNGLSRFPLALLTGKETYRTSNIVQDQPNGLIFEILASISTKIQNSQIQSKYQKSKVRKIIRAND
jgi:hypothetical protein